MSRADSKPREWDAEVYHRVSGPQEAWAKEVVGRLELNGDETVLDAGCGSGRVTEQLIERLPNGHVIAVDASAAMVEEARQHLGDRADVRLGDLSALVLEKQVDLVFSNAVFHWILDHDRLFSVLLDALVPGGRLVAQCGGAGNIADVKRCIETVGERPEFASHLAEMENPWNYGEPDATEESLRAAGFRQARAWLEPRPVTPGEPREFMRAVILAPYLEKIPADLHDKYIDAVIEELGEPHILDYVRLNMEATK